MLGNVLTNIWGRIVTSENILKKSYVQCNLISKMHWKRDAFSVWEPDTRILSLCENSRLIFCVCVSCSVLSNSSTLWTVAYQAPLSKGFFRREYWSGLPVLSPGDLPWPRDWTCVFCIAGRFFTHSSSREALLGVYYHYLKVQEPIWEVEVADKNLQKKKKTTKNKNPIINTSWVVDGQRFQFSSRHCSDFLQRNA